MQITLATPAMLFPAISLLLLAYTNRFLTLATVIRNFGEEDTTKSISKQITNLRKRIQLIKSMQETGAVSFFVCVLSMLAIYLGYQIIGSWLFAFSLICLMYSLLLSVREIRISVEALDVHLDSIKESS